MNAVHVYFAGRSEDMKAVRTLRDRLVPFGITSTARWIDGMWENPRLGAMHCITDIARADALVLVNVAKVHRTGTGGRHVETGIAIATGKPIVVVGERENVFHHLELVRCISARVPVAELASVIREAAAPPA